MSPELISMEWNYQSPVERSTGYEDIMDYLQSFTKERFKSASKEEQDKIIKEV